MRQKIPHPLRNVMLVIEFDGTDYLGWQSQAKGLTVQTIIEDAIKRILGSRSPVLASGRTDAGVHVFALVANVKGHFPMDDAVLQKALNSILPADIAIKEARTVPLNFNAQKDAKWKRYRYLVLNARVRSPMLRRTSWHIIAPLNLKEMRKGAKVLLGWHDFASFMGSNSSVKGTERHIISLTISKRGELVTIEVVANGFLKQMVRNIVGTLVEVGKGRMRAGSIKEVLSARDRRKAGPTAPPQGLFMVEVGYE